MSDFFNKASHGRLIGLLLAISFFFLMFGNGIISLTHPDEVFYVQSAKEMIAHNSWATPYIFDAPQFEKPPLFYWLLIVAIKTFGHSFFALRFWPAAFGILGVMAVYGIAWAMFRQKRTAFLSGFALSACFIYLAMAHAILTDMVFSVWVTIAMGLFYWSYRYPEHKDKGLILTFVVAGISVLTKGVLGFVFPAVAALAFLWYKKDFKFLKTKTVVIGFLLFILTALPWHVLMYQLYGQAFIDEYVHNVHIRRIFEAEHRRCDTWHFYPGVMLGGMMPWSFFLFPAAAFFARELRTKAGKHKDEIVFLLFWILSIFIIMQAAKSKLASYILAVFPAMTILVGHYLNSKLQSIKESEGGLKVPAYVMAGFLCILGIAAFVASRMFHHIIANDRAVYITLILLVLVSATILFYIRKKDYFKVLWAHGGVTAVILATLFLGRHTAEPWVSCKGIIDVFKTIDESDTVVLASKFYVRGVRYYTDRPMAVIDINGKGFFSPHPIPFFRTDGEVYNFLESQPFTFAVVKKGNVEDLERITEGHYRMIHYKDIGGKYIVKFEKLEKRK